MFAQQARALRPDDTRVNELIQDIERALRAGDKPLLLKPDEPKAKSKQDF